MEKQLVRVKIGIFADFIRKMIAFGELYGRSDFKEFNHIYKMKGAIEFMELNKDYSLSLPIGDIREWMNFFNNANFLELLITKMKDQYVLKDTLAALLEVVKEAGIKGKEYQEFETRCRDFNRRLLSLMN
jgi:hypothetical protein